MNKDVIYIDVEDDITAIISKVKASKEKIIALVPPKRIGVLQSAVNLRLLARTAGNSNKRLVIITNNHALSSLAASANLPVAKNLQSKPEIAPISAVEIDDDEEDVIDGNDLPVGEHAKQSEAANDDSAAISAAIATSDMAEPPKAGERTRHAKAKSGPKVPDFNTFRKKMILGIGGGVLLVTFLVWAIFFAPQATVVVAAKTNDSSINAKVTIGDGLTTDLSKKTIKAIKLQKTEKKTIDFAASGSKNIGEKATGTVNLRNSSPNSVSVPGGTTLSSQSGAAFVTSGSVVVPGATLSFSCQPNNLCPGTATVSVVAAEAGAKYNAASGSMSGAPGGVTATLQGPTSGGTDKIARVVTAQDVQKAKESLTDNDTSAAESQLKATAKGGKIIPGSFKVDYTDVKSTPEVDTESQSGNASLSTNVVYSMYSVPSGELTKYLDSYLSKQLSSRKDQRVYDNGATKADFQDVTSSNTGAEATLVATAKVGPRLDEDSIKKQVLGRKTGEIQETLQGIQGIESVEVNYYPFWVTSVPSDEKKVTIQFKVNDAK